ncbi:DEKNAAC101321 [Brettanomyces naardenensis]|uniref:DEKNAAC101321 n=1 Tax=Brettanomyces naardenensis TaxID=13370 RepID=A0A448YI42_BRENA|nr:DEKNAAC101321 [Brettanomyces naardenensis]
MALDMSCTYRLADEDEVEQLPDYTCNVIPVHIDYTGYIANGSTNWNSQLETCKGSVQLTNGWNGTSESENEVIDDNVRPDSGVSVNYLRGRRLLGTTHDFNKDEGYQMVLFKEKDDGIGGLSDDKVLEQKAVCGEVLSYGHDNLPDCDNDPIQRLQEWIDLSRAIHDEN